MNTIASAYASFCKKRFPLPSEAQVDELEQRIGVSFPAEYRRYLLEFNGGYFNEPHILRPKSREPFDRLTCMFGIGASHPMAELCSDALMTLFDDNEPPRVVPIGETITGSLVLLVTQEESFGSVIFKQAYKRECVRLTRNLRRFFRLLHEPLYE